MMDDSSTLPAPIAAGGNRVSSTVPRLADIPEEEIWLAEAKECPHPARLAARRAAFHAHAGDHDAGRAAPGRPQGGACLGALHA
jgi:hypothetical protein